MVWFQFAQSPFRPKVPIVSTVRDQSFGRWERFLQIDRFGWNTQ
jgi:hypothetical protein